MVSTTTPSHSRGGTPEPAAAEPRRVDHESFREEFPSGDPTTTECAQNLVRTTQLFWDADSRAMRDLGLSSPARILLGTLEGAGRPLPHNELAERLFVTGASVTSIVDTLERKGLVRRVRQESDRRVVLVELTEAAYPVIDRFLSQITALHRAEFSVLDEEERETLVRLLGKLAAGIEAADVERAVATAEPRHVPARLLAQRQRPPRTSP